MTTRCKFKCSSITELEQEAFSVELVPVIGGSPENDNFYKWTPGGKFELRTVNSETVKMFRPGKTYYIDISEAI